MTCTMMSFDTSTTSSGWAVYKNAKLKEYGTVVHKEKDVPLSDKMNRMIEDLINLIDKNKPDIVAIERPPFIRDPKTLTALSEIVGSLRAWSILNNADFVEYVPSKWRSLIKSEGEKVPTNRKELKPWDIQKAENLFGIQGIGDDAADAILIGQARINEFLD